MKYLVLVFFSLSVFLPGVADAQLVPCNGGTIPCTECHLVEMGNAVIVWLIGIMFIIFGFVAVAAGWGLVTAGGSPGALSDAKSKFTNAFIGLIIVLAAWLIVDTFMRQLLNNGNLTQFNSSGYSGFGLWSEIDCGTVSQTGSEVRGFGQVIETTSSSCDVVGTTTFGDPIFDCTAQRAECESQPNRVASENTSSAVTTSVECNTVSGAAEGSRYTLSTPGGPVPVTACDPNALQSISFLGRNVQVHRNVAPSLQRVDAAWRARGGNSYYNVREMGSYACRDNVNSSGSKSWHAYGLAIDINASANPNTSKQTPCPSDMPADFVNLLRSEGWGWGGGWNSLCDAMHFSKSLNEGGNMAGD